MKRRVLQLNWPDYPRIVHFGYLGPDRRSKFLHCMAEAGVTYFPYDTADEHGLTGASFPDQQSLSKFLRLLNAKKRMVRL